VDVSEDADARTRAPRAYQVVSEDRFDEYQRTGVLPPAATPAATVVEEPAEADGETPAASSAGQPSSEER
jgi:hypothetical protein